MYLGDITAVNVEMNVNPLTVGFLIGFLIDGEVKCL